MQDSFPLDNITTYLTVNGNLIMISIIQNISKYHKLLYVLASFVRNCYCDIWDGREFLGSFRIN